MGWSRVERGGAERMEVCRGGEGRVAKRSGRRGREEC